VEPLFSRTCRIFLNSGVAKRVRGVRTAPGGNLLGAAKGQFKKKSRENADCKFHMCLRMRAVKKKHYSQRVPIVGYKFESLDVSCSTLLVLRQFRIGAGR